MPVTYDIDHEKRLVAASPHGLLTDAEIFGYQKEVWSRADTRGYDELIDMGGVTQVEFISTERVSKLADLSGIMDSPAIPSKLAIVATSDLHFGLGRMYQSHREMAVAGTKTVRVFRVRAEALKWLDAP
jgi:hypothetical protein